MSLLVLALMLQQSGRSVHGVSQTKGSCGTFQLQNHHLQLRVELQLALWLCLGLLLWPLWPSMLLLAVCLML